MVVLNNRVEDGFNAGIKALAATDGLIGKRRVTAVYPRPYRKGSTGGKFFAY